MGLSPITRTQVNADCGIGRPYQFCGTTTEMFELFDNTILLCFYDAQIEGSC